MVVVTAVLVATLLALLNPFQPKCRTGLATVHVLGGSSGTAVVLVCPGPYNEVFVTPP
jgi:hypothetical protein